MTYYKLIELLNSDYVYNKLKINEEMIFNLIPELEACKGFNQNNEWHVYDVYEHILHVIKGVNNNKCLRIAALFHDIGKPLTYKEDENGVGHFYNHWNKSIEIFKKYHSKFDLENEEISLINNLIFYHDVNISKMNINDKYKMLNDISSSNINLLFDLKKSDLLAQSPKFHYLLDNINEQENEINVIIETKINDNEEIINSAMFYNKIEYNNLIILIDNIIKFKTVDENKLSYIYDRILSLEFINEFDIKRLFYKLFNYTKTVNLELSVDYESIFLKQFFENNNLDEIILKKVKKQ